MGSGQMGSSADGQIGTKPFCRVTGCRPVDRLTWREWEVIGQVATGASNAEIGRALGVSLNTIKGHMTHIFDKLGLGNRTELALWALEHHKAA